MNFVGYMALLGHLVGDYIIQNDWMAAWKTRRNATEEEMFREHLFLLEGQGRADAIQCLHWRIAFKGMLACTIHCALYTLSVSIFCYAWITPSAVALIFLAHWPVDRYRLAYLWMTRVSRQAHFARGIMAPWSVVVVDNTFHLLTIALAYHLFAK